MSKEYDDILALHSANIKKAFYWIRKSLPEILIDIPGVDYELMILLHDDTKTIPDEYDAYDEYLFGKHTKDTMRKFRLAKLQHHHTNAHHWQHWILVTNEGAVVPMDMPYECIVEMICDWWSFSWRDGDLYQIFDWYEENKKHMRVSKKTRVTIEDILDKLHAKLEKVRGPRKER